MKPFEIPAEWTPEQAMAVVDLLDELREHIWAKYELKLMHVYRHEFAELDHDNTEPFVDDQL